jgi:Cys-tRNA(Pro)/Cys-tRNA(Cys) deacylase
MAHQPGNPNRVEGPQGAGADRNHLLATGRPAIITCWTYHAALADGGAPRSDTALKQKTNSMRLLESHGISYRIHRFSPDIHSAEAVAEVLGVPAREVFKTLVVMRQKGRPLLVLVPADATLDLKLLARSLGEKKLRMARHQEAEECTGLQVGGISALALAGRSFDVCADESILCLSRVVVSAGRRGIDLSLRPDDLLRVTNAQAVPAIAGSEE